MKNHLLVCLLVWVSCFDIKAQHITYTEGESFPVEENSHFLYVGHTRQLLLFEVKNPQRDLNTLYVVDSATLRILWEATYGQLAINGERAFAISQDNNIVLISSLVRRKESVLVNTFTAHILNIENGIRPLEHHFFDTCMADAEPYFERTGKDTFYLLSGGRYRFYDSRLQRIQVQYYDEERSSPMPIRYNNNARFSYVATRFRSYWGPKVDWESFYPVYYGANYRYFVRSEFIIDTFSYMTNGHYEVVQVMAYKLNRNKLKKVHELRIREGSYALNYNVHRMHDGNLLITGVYQDKTKEGENVHIGIFSKILDKDLKDLTVVNYREVINTQREGITAEPNYKLLMDLNKVAQFYQVNVHSQRDYVVEREPYVICINKQSGLISFDGLVKKYKPATKGMYNFVADNYKFTLDDSTCIFIQYDHPSNIGRTASDTFISMTGQDTGEFVLSYVTFSDITGFSKRTLIYDPGLNTFVIGMLLKVNYYTVDPKNGRQEIIAAAYNKDNSECRFIRLVIMPRKISMQD